MKRSGRVLLAAMLALACDTALSYTRPRWYVGPDIVQPRWPVSHAIPVVVNTDPPNLIVPGSQPFEAVRNMFELRSVYTTLRFAPVASSSPESIGWDGTNLVTFKDTPSNRSAVFGFGAVTMFRWVLVNDEPVLVESDIVFSPTLTFTTTGSGGTDIENLGGHELIHFVACDHSAVMGATAFPNYYTESPNERNLALDDLAAGNLLYPFPETASKTGSLSGVIEKPGGVPVFGAHVVALRQSDGAPVSDISVIGGAWRIDGLPPGQYVVYTEPLDGPSEPGNTLFTGIYTSTTPDVTFPTTFAGGLATPTLYEVVAGAETQVGTLLVGTSAGPINLRRLGLGPFAVAVIGASAINVTQGDSGYLTLQGPGVNLVPNYGVRITGSGVNVSSVGVGRGTAGGVPYMVLPLSVDLEAPPGVRTIVADDGTNVAVVTGGIEVHPWNSYPNLLRNDSLTSLASLGPGLSGLLPLDPFGPDNFPGNGEGLLRELPGSDDDDDLYAPSIESGFLDPDLAVLTDPARPLVFYQLDDPNRTIFLGKSDSGRIVVTYSDAP